MKIDDVGWWLIVLWNFASYFIYSFGNISRGNSKVVIEFVGGAFFLFSFVTMFVLFGIKSGIILILLALLITAPLTGLLIAYIEKKLYGHYSERERLSVSTEEKDKRLLNALNKGMFEAHKDHAHLHPELQKKEAESHRLTQPSQRNY